MDQYNNYIGLTLDGRYTIKKLVGVGGMAMVFEADDLFRKTVVAVKILKEEFASDEVSVQRFINESKAVLMLSHTNIVKIFDVSVKGEHKYIVMEYIDGITLKNYIERKGALSVKEAISYTIQILRALEHAHIGGVVHRDIKPQNIMLLKNGQIKVTDFGIAKLPDAKTLTATDKAIGTVYYISPEQAAGEKGIDRRTDLYSVGVMLYEMLTGKLPFDGENPVSIALKQINEQPKPPTEIVSSIPKGLEQIILFAMEKDKDKRFQTATQMIELLQKVRENPMVIFRQKHQTNTAKSKKKTSMMPIIVGVVTAFLLVFLVSGVVLINEIFFSEAATAEHTVKVADYVGKSYDEIEDEIRDEFFNVKRVYVASAKEEKGIILRQSPSAGENKNSTEITLYIGEGIEEVVIENYLNKTRMEAEVDLAKKGLRYDYRHEPSATVSSGRVISTLPAAGETVTVGTTVTLILSSGDDLSEADVTDMPYLVGMTTAEAYEVLVKDKLRFSAVYYEYSEEYAAGKVIEQSPVEGTSVPKGITKVTLVVSKGAPPKTTSTVPLINGLTQSEAEASLKANDLTSSFTYAYSDSVAAGVVFGQIPSSGSIVDIGFSVTFVVSKGPEPYIPVETTTEPIVTEEPAVTEEPITVTEEKPEVTTAATTKKDPITGRFN